MSDRPRRANPQDLFGVGLRELPANLNAEQALLGAILTNNRAYDRVAEFLQEHHFADPVNGLIYSIAARRIEAGKIADAVTLKVELENTHDLQEAGGAEYLVGLLTAMVGIINAGDYGKAILDAWMRRELIDAGVDQVNDSFGRQAGESAHEILDNAETRLMRIAEGAGNVAPTVPLGGAVNQALTMMHAAKARGTGLAGLSTGLAALDRMTGGLMPATLVVLAARPSMGKTALGLTIAARAAALGAKTLFWSGEMSAAQLGARVAAAWAGISTMSVFTARGFDLPADVPENQGKRPLRNDEIAALESAEAAAGRLPVQIDDRPGVTVSALRARARRMKRAGGLDLIVIDYIGLLRGSQATQGRGLYERITEISGDLKALSKEIQVPVLALAQLNRANEQREDKRPTLSDLRDSGAIEQDADIVAFLHREHYYLLRQAALKRREKETDADYFNRSSAWADERNKSEGKAEVILAKNRQGPTGVTRLAFQDHTTWFRDEAEEQTSPAWPVI